MRSHYPKIVDKALILAKNKLNKTQPSSNFVCFECRFNCKRPGPCPTCGNELYQVGFRARIPAKTLDGRWKQFEKKFKPANYVPYKPIKNDKIRMPEEKWTCLVCEEEHVVPRIPQPNAVPESLQKMICEYCYVLVTEYLCVKREECKPNNKNKFSKKERCPICIEKNAKSLGKRLKALEAVNKL